MSNVLVLEVYGDEVPGDVNAPLSEAELGRIEKFVADFRAGRYGVTNDPAELKPETEAQCRIYRKELVEA